MKVTPIKQYNGSYYPTRNIIDEYPELLRLVPKRWQGNATVIAALTGLCVLMAGARSVDAKGSSNAVATRVAPIFDHGDGRGSFGCKAINPPVFLSEAEACAVITEEAKRFGIKFKPDGLTLPNVAVPITNRYGFDDGKNMQARAKNQPLALDGVDVKRHIAFEYVSSDDFDAWQTKNPEMMSTASYVDIKGTASDLAGNLKKTKSGETIAVFYDPCNGTHDVEKKLGYKMNYQTKDWQAEYTKMEQKARQLSSEELRKQVRDFVKWLKAQGVI